MNIRHLIAAALVWTAVWTVAAQEPPAAEIRIQATPTEQQDLRLDTAEASLELSLEEAVAIALERNLDLLVQRYDYRDSELAILGSEGIFDLRLNSSLFAQDRENPTFSTIQASQSESRSVNLGLAQLFSTGGDLSVSWFNARSESDRSLINPTFSSSLDLQFDQPLLQGFGALPTRRGIRLARLDNDISLEQLEQQASQTILDVENAYWSLIDAREQLVVAREARALAQELHERNEIEVEVGTRAPLELVQSEATIALREEEIILAETTLGDAEDELRRLLNLPPDAWTVPIEPTTEAEVPPLTIDLDEAIETAMAERPELASQRLRVEQAELDSAYFRNQKLPGLDLQVSYGSAGTVGRGELQTADDVLVFDDSLPDAIDQVVNRDFTSWSAQLVFAYPLQNRAARANSASADVALERTEVQLAALEQDILAEVRSAVRQVSSAAQQIESARVSRRLQERNLEAEQKRYENGMSTSFQVTEIQEDLTQARSREVSALTSYRTALASYYRAVGRLLEESGVSVVDVDDESAGE